jgi:putative NADH-flavin reductase
VQITVFGASGKVGRLVVAEALSRGHDVIAFVHRHNALTANPRLRIAGSDIHSAADVAMSLRGSQGVISCLGSWGTHSKDIVSSGMRQIIPAMQAESISRIVSLTGSGANAPADKDTPITITRRVSHWLADRAAGKVLRDGEHHILLLAQSSLEWTVLRSPIMYSGGDGLYRLTLRPAGVLTGNFHPQLICRRAVAKALVDQLEGPGYLHAAPFIYRK